MARPFREHLLGLHVLPLLQVRVDQVVERVHVVVGIAAALLGRRRGDIALDRLRPHAEQHVDVRGHVQRMRHRRRELVVAARGVEAALGQRRVVVAVDDVVRGAGMIRLGGHDLLGQLSRFLLLGVGLVVRLRGGLQRERVEGHRLAVLRIASVHLGHRLLVGERSCLVVELVPVLVEGLGGGDPIALALRLGRRGLGLLDRFPPALEVRRARRRPDLIPQAHGDAPVAHRAVRVRLGDGGERLHRLEVPERVQERDPALERLLHRRIAGDGKRHLPDLVTRRLRRRRRDHEKSDNRQTRPDEVPHACLLRAQKVAASTSVNGGILPRRRDAVKASSDVPFRAPLSRRNPRRDNQVNSF